MVRKVVLGVRPKEWIFRLVIAVTLSLLACYMFYSRSVDFVITARNPYYPLLAEHSDLGDDGSIAKVRV